MNTSIVNAHRLQTQSDLKEASPTITESFSAGRSASCLLFDFSEMASLMKPSELSQPILDFGSGAGWMKFRDGDTLERLRLTNQLPSLNYWDRVIFYVDKP